MSKKHQQFCYCNYHCSGLVVRGERTTFCATVEEAASLT